MTRCILPLLLFLVCAAPAAAHRDHAPLPASRSPAVDAAQPQRLPPSARSATEALPPQRVFDEEQLSRLVENAVQRQLAPLARQFAEERDRQRLCDVIGGIGYLVGIAGLIARARSRRKGQGEA